MKFKLDENLSPSLLAMFADVGHDAHSVVQQSLGGQPDERVIDVCRREGRALITLDLDFSNILTYSTRQFHGHRRAASGKRLPREGIYWRGIRSYGVARCF